MMVAGVIVVIADLQQKTAGPKIELLQTVKKGGEERRGRRSFDHQQKWHGWRGGRGRPLPRQKRSLSKPRYSSGVSPKQNILTLLADHTKKRVASRQTFALHLFRGCISARDSSLSSPPSLATSFHVDFRRPPPKGPPHWQRSPSSSPLAHRQHHGRTDWGEP